MIALDDLSPENLEWINKAIGQFRLQLNGAMSPFSMYGQDIYIPPAIEAITELAWQLHLRLSGIDTPIQLENDFEVQPD